MGGTSLYTREALVHTFRHCAPLTLGFPGAPIAASSASFVSALRAESAVAPLLLLSPANPLTLGFARAPKADSPLYTKGPLVHSAQDCPPLGIHCTNPKVPSAPAVGTKRRKQCVSTPPLIRIRAEYQCEHVLHRFVKSL